MSYSCSATLNTPKLRISINFCSIFIKSPEDGIDTYLPGHLGLPPMSCKCSTISKTAKCIVLIDFFSICMKIPEDDIDRVSIIMPLHSRYMYYFAKYYKIFNFRIDEYHLTLTPRFVGLNYWS